MADNNEKKKKSNKGKAAFMFAFAVTVLGSRAASLGASAAPINSDEDFDNLTTDSINQGIGTDIEYYKVDSNVFAATDQAKCVNDLTKAVKDVNHYGIFANTLNIERGSQHIESNI